jgi:ribosome recycling factor
MQTVVRKTEQEMKRIVEATLKNFNGVRTGRASVRSWRASMWTTTGP